MARTRATGVMWFMQASRSVCWMLQLVAKQLESFTCPCYYNRSFLYVTRQPCTIRWPVIMAVAFSCIAYNRVWQVDVASSCYCCSTCYFYVASVYTRQLYLCMYNTVCVCTIHKYTLNKPLYVSLSKKFSVFIPDSRNKTATWHIWYVESLIFVFRTPWSIYMCERKPRLVNGQTFDIVFSSITYALKFVYCEQSLQSILNRLVIFFHEHCFVTAC